MTSVGSDGPCSQLVGFKKSQLQLFWRIWSTRNAVSILFCLIHAYLHFNNVTPQNASTSTTKLATCDYTTYYKESYSIYVHLNIRVQISYKHRCVKDETLLTSILVTIHLCYRCLFLNSIGKNNSLWLTPVLIIPERLMFRYTRCWGPNIPATALAGRQTGIYYT